MADEKQPTHAGGIETGDESAPKAEGAAEITVSPSFASYYANSARLFGTPWDIRLIFGEIGPGRDGTSLVLEQRVSIVMSYQHAKALSLMLDRNLKERESAVGTMNLESQTAGEPKN